MTAAIFWLILGGIGIVLEATVIPGVGLFFAGLGGITTGGLMALGVLGGFGYSGQAVMFLIFTGIWWVILWKPLKKATSPAAGGGYKNLSGTSGTVDEEGGLIAGKVGHVVWSGTRMRARIRPESEVESIGKGVTVWSYGQQNGVLLVDDKEPDNN